MATAPPVASPSPVPPASSVAQVPAAATPSSAPATTPAAAGATPGLLTDPPTPEGLVTGDPAPDPNATPPDPDANAVPEPPPEGAPEAYADFDAPEGVVLDATSIDSFKGVAKELNLPQAKAQEIVNLGAALVQRTIDSLVEGFTQTRTEWLTQSKASFEAPALAKAKLGLETFGTPELTKFLREEQLENHPEIIRLLARVGELASEDGFVAAGSTSPRGDKSLAERMFPAHSNQ